MMAELLEPQASQLEGEVSVEADERVHYWAWVRAWVERRAEQGVTVKVTDPLVLAEVAEILRSARREFPPRWR
jgi:hypothetical protein